MRLKSALTPILCLIYMQAILSQDINTKGARVATTLEVPSLINRALIVGISDYMNITDLNYAHTDALNFYHYLISPAGGSLDSSEVMVLLNDEATTANFFAGLDWLLAETREGETVAVYFSGHGDLETKTIRQNGFLLGYDSPKACYMAGAIGVGYVQDYLETLVSANKAQVILISDACRSGKLTGGSEGLTNTTAALAEKWANITKILSSQAGELSLESTKWGNGAGVFTHYLIQGLTGMADRNNDKMVNLRELFFYISDNVGRESNFSQNPVVDGDQTAVLSYIDSLSLAALIEQENPVGEQYLAMNTRGSMDDLEEQLDPEVFEMYSKFRDLLEEGKLVKDRYDDEAEFACSYYEKLIADERATKIHDRMKRSLLAALQNKTQSYLNNYVKGKDVSEEIDIWLAIDEQRKAYEIADPNSILYNSIKARYLFMETYYAKNETEALELLLECIRIEPDAAYAYNGLGVIYEYTLLDYKKAIESYEAAIGLAPNWSWPYVNLGNVYLGWLEYEMAEHYYDLAIGIDSSLITPYYNKGILYSITGDTAGSIEMYLKAMAIDSAFSKVYSQLGALYVGLGMDNEAELLFDDCISFLGQEDGYYTLGLLYENLYDFKKAGEYYLKGLEYVSNSEKLLIKLGAVYYIIRQYEDAIEFYNRVLEVNPKSEDAYDGLGNTFSSLEKYRESIRYHRKSIELNPARKRGYVNLCMAYYWLGDEYFDIHQYDSAMYYYQEAFFVNPEYTDAFDKFEEAEKLYMRSSDKAPESFNYYKRSGYTYLKMEMYKKSLKSFEKAIELAPEEPGNYYNVACYYAVQGIMDDAFEWLETALEKGFDDFDHLRTDPDIAILRESEEFKRLLEKYEEEVDSRQ